MQSCVHEKLCTHCLCLRVLCATCRASAAAGPACLLLPQPEHLCCLCSTGSVTAATVVFATTAFMQCAGRLLSRCSRTAAAAVAGTAAAVGTAAAAGRSLALVTWQQRLLHHQTRPSSPASSRSQQQSGEVQLFEGSC